MKISISGIRWQVRSYSVQPPTWYKPIGQPLTGRRSRKAANAGGAGTLTVPMTFDYRRTDRGCVYPPSHLGRSPIWKYYLQPERAMHPRQCPRYVESKEENTLVLSQLRSSSLNRHTAWYPPPCKDLSTKEMRRLIRRILPLGLCL